MEPFGLFDLKNINETLPRFITVEAVNTTMKTVLTIFGMKDMKKKLKTSLFSSNSLIFCAYNKNNGKAKKTKKLTEAKCKQTSNQRDNIVFGRR